MTGLEFLRASGTTVEEIADVVSAPCPPYGSAIECDHVSCRERWLAWLTTGEPPKEEGPSDKQTAPDEEGLHPNLAEQIRRQRKIWKMTCEMLEALTHPNLSASAPLPHGKPCAQP